MGKINKHFFFFFFHFVFVHLFLMDREWFTTYMNETMRRLVDAGAALYTVCYESDKRCPLLVSKDPTVAAAMCVFLNQWIGQDGRVQRYRCFRSDAVVCNRVFGFIQEINVVDGSRVAAEDLNTQVPGVHCILHGACPPIESSLHPRIDSMNTPILVMAGGEEQIYDVSFFASLNLLRGYLQGKPAHKARLTHISSWYTERLQFNHSSLSNIGPRVLFRATSWHIVLRRILQHADPMFLHETRPFDLRIILDPFAIYRLATHTISSIYVVQEWRRDGSRVGLCVTSVLQEALYALWHVPDTNAMIERVVVRAHYASFTISGWIPSTPNQVMANRSGHTSGSMRVVDINTARSAHRGVVVFQTSAHVTCAMSAESYFAHTKNLQCLVPKLEHRSAGTTPIYTPVMTIIY